jgi:hypothetical protein
VGKGPVLSSVVEGSELRPRSLDSQVLVTASDFQAVSWERVKWQQ